MSQEERVKEVFRRALVTNDYDYYRPFMESVMKDVCIRSTLMLLKESWRKHLIEFDMIDDMHELKNILQRFPFLTKEDEDDFVDVEDDVLDRGIFPLADLDVRSMALCLFHKICDTTDEFFKAPPHAYYVESQGFFKAKVQLLRLYNQDREIQERIQTMSGFGNEERSWIMVDYWRNMYIQKLEEYFEGQPESWRLCCSLDSTYFRHGIQNYNKPPPFEYVYERPLVYISDNKLMQVDSPMGHDEKNRRNSAKESMIMIAQRWGCDF